MTALPYQKFVWGDYYADTQHLSCMEHGAYLLLIGAMWLAGGSLPNDDAYLARVARCTRGQWTRMRPTIMAFFSADGDVVTHHRIKSDLSHATDVVKAHRDAGRKGAEARKSKKNNGAPQANGHPNGQPDAGPNDQPSGQQDAQANAQANGQPSCDIVSVRDPNKVSYKRDARTGRARGDPSRSANGEASARVAEERQPIEINEAARAALLAAHDAKLAADDAWATERRLRDRLAALEATAARSAAETKATRMRHTQTASPELAQAITRREEQEQLDRERAEAVRLDVDLALAEAEALSDAARKAWANAQRERGG